MPHVMSVNLYFKVCAVLSRNREPNLYLHPTRSKLFMIVTLYTNYCYIVWITRVIFSVNLI